MKNKIINTINDQSTHMVISYLDKTPSEIERITQDVDPHLLQTRQDPDSWSAVEILAHLHACATIWGKSIQEMIEENNPIIEDLHPRKWKKLSEFSIMAFEQSLQEFILHRRILISRLITLSADDWGKSGWIKNKKHTIFSQARRMALHELDHLDQLEKTF